MSEQTKKIELGVDMARGIYKDADAALRSLLETSFTKVELSGSIMDRVKTYADVCGVLGIHPFNSLPYPNAKTKDQHAVNSFFKCMNIATVLNEGWEPDWSNKNQYKYYVWLGEYKAGSGFSHSDFDDSYADTFVGSRLCFPTSELAMHASTQFLKEFNEYFLNL